MSRLPQLMARPLWSVGQAQAISLMRPVRKWTGVPQQMGMAGHSKWHNIRHKKAAGDAQKSVVNAKVSQQIKTALNQGGNSDSNALLKKALDKAKEMKVPKAIIDRAIQKYEQAKDGGSVRYEGTAPGGVSVLVACITDNKNRTLNKVREIFTKNGGNMGSENAVAHKFNHVGQLTFSGVEADQSDKLVDAAISLGVEEVDNPDDNVWEFTCTPKDLNAVESGLKEAGFEADSASLRMIPYVKVEVAEDKTEALTKFLETMMDNEDVEDIYHDAA